MWTRVSQIAKNFGLDDDDMVQFAEDNSDKYHIVNEHGYPEVNTWNCNDLIADFKKQDLSLDDAIDLLHDTAQEFWLAYSQLVNETLLKVPSSLRDNLEERLQEASNVYSRTDHPDVYRNED